MNKCHVLDEESCSDYRYIKARISQAVPRVSHGEIYTFRDICFHEEPFPTRMSSEKSWRKFSTFLLIWLSKSERPEVICVIRPAAHVGLGYWFTCVNKLWRLYFIDQPEKYSEVQKHLILLFLGAYCDLSPQPWTKVSPPRKHGREGVRK